MTVRTALINIREGEVADAYEAAKSLMRSGRIPIKKLADIALDKSVVGNNRAAALYALGASSYRRRREVTPTFIAIMCDLREDDMLRCEAAEKLASRNDRKAVPVLVDVLTSRETSDSLKAECIFALSEIGGAQALSALEQVGRLNPDGRVAEELAEALDHINRGRGASS
jgi:hypothetical protein